MSKEITRYDRELADRLEKIREENGYSKEDMAFLMSVDVGTYKRYAYKISKVPAGAVAELCDALQLDLTYVVYGRDRSAIDFVKYFETVDDEKLADMFSEAAREARIRAKTREKVYANREKQKTKRASSRKDINKE